MPQDPLLEPTSPHLKDECERCHKLTRVRWYEDAQTGAEWCYCDPCRDLYEQEEGGRR